MQSEVVMPAGQLLTKREALAAGVSANSLAQLTRVPAVTRQGSRGSCRRCGSRLTAMESELPDGRWYCPVCLTLGRMVSGDELYEFASQTYPHDQTVCTWTGSLTAAQERVAGELQASFAAGREHLLWAVTGAGKTEMLFPVLHKALNAGGRVAVVSPRVDVINELAPRIQAAFSQTPLVVRHGQAEPVPVQQLLLATVHQLLRFKATFDLIVVDEVDAFPYSADPMLERAVRRAGRGRIIFLTATPSQSLLRQTKRGKLQISYLPRRFHGHDLPVPQLRFVKGATLLNPQIRRLIARVIQETNCSLIFVPGVAQLQPVARFVATLGVTVSTVHSAEPDRAERVLQLRRGELRVLVTTTILERGVTFAHCGVIVLQADAPLFGAAALAQMAGRAGRNRDFPDDPVYFVAARYTRAMAQACGQIRQMNRRRAE